MTDFFGYGSLVNLQTHQYLNPRPTKIKGWKRKWVSSNIHDIAFLSVSPCDLTILHGMRASTKNIGWKALDLRETGYIRHSLDNYNMQEHQQCSIYFPLLVDIFHGWNRRYFD